MTKAFVTGATGFIGGNLVKKLIQDEQYESINCVIRNPEKFTLSESDKVNVFKGDITQPETMRNAMEGVDVVFHLAAYYELGIAKSEIKNMHNINIQGTDNVLSLAKSLDIANIIYVSTVFVLGATGDEIATEEFLHCGKFTCHYEQTKFVAHQVALKYIAEGLPVIMILPGAVYGEDDPSVIGDSIEKLVAGKFPGMIKGSEKSKITYVHVEDVVDGIMLAQQKGRVGEAYILAAEVMGFMDMMKAVTQIAGSKMPSMKIPLKLARILAFFDERISRFFGKKPMISQEALNSLLENFAVSADKAKIELGFSPRSNIEGFTQTINHIKK